MCKPKLRRLAGSFISIAFVSLLVAGGRSVPPVQADTGPELEASTDIGSSISPYKFKSTRVQMVDEQVHLKQDMVVEGENTLSQVSVQADFHMRNTSATTESMQAVFPMTDLRCDFLVGPAMGGGIRELELDEATFAISIDGQIQSPNSLTTTTLIPVEQFDYFGNLNSPLAPESLTQSTPLADKTASVIYDANGQALYPCKTEWKTFAITFPPHEDVSIKVSYAMKPRFDFTLYPWDTFTYILRTGRPWYGPIGQVDVSLQLPYPVSSDLLTQLPFGSKISGNTISWQWKNMEPNANLQFTVLSPQGWKDLQARREEVRAHPEEASAWAALGDYYYSLARPPDYPAGYYDPLHETDSYFPQVVDWRYTHLASDAYRQAIRLQPEANKWHAALGKLLASMSLSANDGMIRLGFPSAQSALRELERGVSKETDTEGLLTMFKNMAGQQIPTN